MDIITRFRQNFRIMLKLQYEINIEKKLNISNNYRKCGIN